MVHWLTLGQSNVLLCDFRAVLLASSICIVSKQHGLNQGFPNMADLQDQVGSYSENTVPQPQVLTDGLEQNLRNLSSFQAILGITQICYHSFRLPSQIRLVSADVSVGAVGLALNIHRLYRLSPGQVGIFPKQGLRLCSKSQMLV